MIINKLKRYFTSIRFLVTLIIVCVGVIPVWMTTELVCYWYYQKEVSDRMVTMQNSCVTMADRLSSHMIQGGGIDNILSAELDTYAESYEGRVQIIDANYRIVTDTYRVSEGKYCISKEVFQGFATKSYSNVDKENAYMEFVSPIKTPNSEVVGVIVVSSSITGIQNRYEDIHQQISVFRIVFLLILIPLALFLAEIVENPFRKLIRVLKRINEGNPEIEIENKGYTEIKDINNGYSGAMVQLREVDKSRQEFVSNVSHELKTPITSIKVLVDTLLASDHVPEEMYREFLEDIASEINRENDIVNDLLSMVRLDRGSAELHFEKVNINDFVEDVLRRLKPIAAGRNIELTFETFRPVMAEIDEVKMSLAIMNIVENAIKYNVDSGWVKVSLNADHKYFYVDISDSGVGIPEDAISKIFERFYRVDKARSRDTGGTGLGLSISKKIVVLHHGSIDVESTQGKGTRFIIRVPLQYQND